jgi:type IV pilus assembly protein PilN
MKLPINLASEPFRRDRAMLVASIAVSLVLVAMLGGLVSLALDDRAQLADVRGDISRLNQEIRRVMSEQAQLETVLRRPENAEVLERSVFINALLARKGISWTRIFADLEKRVPHNVRVIQIHPSIDSQYRVSLDMTVASESPAAGIDLLKALESEPFSLPAIRQTMPPTQSEPFFRYRLSVDYAQKL